MHGAAETLLEVFAGGAHSAAHPSAVSHNLETVVPDIKQVVFMDIALSEGAVDVRTGGDVAVEQYRADIDAGTTEEIAVAYLFFVFAGIGFTAEFQIDTAFFARGGDKLQHLFYLRAAEHQLAVARCSSDRCDGEQPPAMKTRRAS